MVIEKTVHKGFNVKILHLEAHERSSIFNDIDSRIARQLDKGELKEQEEAVFGEHFGFPIIEHYPEISKELSGMKIFDYIRNSNNLKRGVIFIE